MKIKSNKRSLSSVLFPDTQSPRLRLAAIVIYSLVFLFAGAFGYQKLLEADIPTKIWNRIYYVKEYAVANFKARPEFLKIDIAHKHYMRLNYTREQALAKGKLVSSPDDMVPAQITHRGKVYDVKLRLKGDFIDHWEDEHKWSFRIRVRGDNTLFGMKQFSVQNPGTRGFIYEWITHKALRTVDLPSLRYDFIRLIVNGRDLGVYALEEHFDKHLIENSRRREGPIVRYDEDLCFSEVIRGIGGDRDRVCALTGAGSFLAAYPDAFHTNKLLADPVKAEQIVKAMHLLEQFRHGDLPTNQVFDVEQLAKFFAIVELVGSMHMANWRNMRFYYNPVTSRLEPVGFDGGDGRHAIPILAPLINSFSNSARDHEFHYRSEFFDLLFRDDVFLQAYIGQLERVTEQGYLESFLHSIEDELQEKLWIIHSEMPSYHYHQRRFYENRRYIRSTLNAPKVIHAYLKTASRDRVDLSIGNLQYLPVEIIALQHTDTGTRLAKASHRFPARSPRQPVSYETVSFRLPASEIQETVDVRHLQVRGAKTC